MPDFAEGFGTTTTIDLDPIAMPTGFTTRETIERQDRNNRQRMQFEEAAILERQLNDLRRMDERQNIRMDGHPITRRPTFIDGFNGDVQFSYGTAMPPPRKDESKQKMEIRVVKKDKAYHVSLVVVNEGDREKDRWVMSTEQEVYDAVARFYEMFNNRRASTDVRLRNNMRSRGHLTRDDRLGMRQVDGLEDTGEDNFGLSIDDSIDDVVDEFGMANSEFTGERIPF